MLNIGQEAPSFCIPNQDNVEICLRDLKGKWIVLYFYPKDNTPGCTNEACDFTQAEPQFDDLDAVILGVSPDSPKKHQGFIEKQKLTITLLSDEDTAVAQSYGVWQMKKNYGREYMGISRTTFLIDPDGKIAHIWENVKVRQKKKINKETVEVLHAQLVKEQLQQLQNS
ncbi:MAG: thioredoxin-dependent thiol peroxidase [Campylobacterales bacterium]|nr:thioredoxin-dependent thiol peroxidase [Campylobacterales bacterium]